MKFYSTLALLMCASTLQGQDISDLNWLAGYWAGIQDGTIMEEIWTPPDGGIMIGMHRDVFRSDRSFFEFLRIQYGDERITYLASPNGNEPTPFFLTSLVGQRAVFENLEHDFPQRIIYEREGNQLLVLIEDKDGNNSRSWIWERTNF